MAIIAQRHGLGLRQVLYSHGFRGIFDINRRLCATPGCWMTINTRNSGTTSPQAGTRRRRRRHRLPPRSRGSGIPRFPANLFQADATRKRAGECLPPPADRCPRPQWPPLPARPGFFLRRFRPVPTPARRWRQTVPAGSGTRRISPASQSRLAFHRFATARTPAFYASATNGRVSFDCWHCLHVGTPRSGESSP